jgi:hypothetical protein
MDPAFGNCRKTGQTEPVNMEQTDKRCFAAPLFLDFFENRFII